MSEYKLTATARTLPEVCEIFNSEPWEGTEDEIQAIYEMCLKVFCVTERHKKICCSISGGYDSDIMLDMLERFGAHGKTDYVFLDTGLEYDATKRHIENMKKIYGIKVIKLKPENPIPKCVKEYGVPFWSKDVSQKIYLLQKHEFRWEDEPFEELCKKYPDCTFALKWWCNEKPGKRFNISNIRGLKEFLIQNPPRFKISAKCCDYAKKKPAKHHLAHGGYDLNCIGVRKEEGGVRATAYKSCYDGGNWGEADNFRPIFWMTDTQKEIYRTHYGITRSDCYEVWGMQRTGCAGCPFGKKIEPEIALVKKYEPKRHAAMISIFGESYEYTRQFMEFREEIKKREKEEKERNRLSQYPLQLCLPL